MFTPASRPPEFSPPAPLDRLLGGHEVDLVRSEGVATKTLRSRKLELSTMAGPGPVFHKPTEFTFDPPIPNAFLFETDLIT